MLPNRQHSGGFVLVEFAIALPLLILLGLSLAQVSIKIFQLGKIQLADYVLETEAQYVVERITHQARVAKEVEIDNAANQIKFVYHTVNEKNTSEITPLTPQRDYQLFTIHDVRETQYFIPHKNAENIYVNLNAKRNLEGARSNPITGDNYFGDTKINSLHFTANAQTKILHVTLEMESLVTARKIKLGTAVFMPSCDSVIIAGGT